MKKQITVEFVFAIIQSIIALSALVIAILLHFSFLNQSILNIPLEDKYFYVVILVIFGFAFLISGAFLIYEWWEKR